MPILHALMKNSQMNARRAKNANRHDAVMKEFASALFCIVGRSGYEFIKSNFGDAIPSLSTVNRVLSIQKNMKEGHFYFNELKEHLLKWKSPLFVHVHVDDTRTLNHVEYDPLTDRFVGFCLPNKDGIPDGDAFVLHSFEEIKAAFEVNKISKYVHFMVARPISYSPAFVFFIFGTDGSYNYIDVLSRFRYVTAELLKIGVTVLSFGADGAGPFLKAMLNGSQLFSKSVKRNVPSSWNFYRMPRLLSNSLFAQDVIHLLAKMRTRLLLPSNILVLGDVNACAAHLKFIISDFPKEQHGLSARCLDVRDKQNYSCIETILGDGVFECLEKLDNKLCTKGTRKYLEIMRNIRDSFLNKSLSLQKRLYLAWKSLFQLRIWRVWLNMNGYKEEDHFVTSNAYICLELNCHFLLNVAINVKNGIFPPEALRFWLCGSQACEETFRILRSMSPMFSTIVNFTVKGIIQRVHRLNYLSSIECSEIIAFPRVKRRLLQCNEESRETLMIPETSFDYIIMSAKQDAIESMKSLGIFLGSYDDNYLICSEVTTNEAISKDGEDEEPGEIDTESQVEMMKDESIIIREDLSNLRLQKSSNYGLPIYEEFDTTSATDKKTYKLMKNDTCSPFVVYGGKYIRKTTAIYLIQEKEQLSNDRLLRVRANNPDHLYSVDSKRVSASNTVRAGDLCAFRRIDDDKKFLLGRVIQFSYLNGNKRQRQYSSNFVDLTKDSIKNIGALCNWYKYMSFDKTKVFFEPLSMYTAGYIPFENYHCTVSDTALSADDNCSFTVLIKDMENVATDWNKSFFVEDD